MSTVPTPTPSTPPSKPSTGRRGTIAVVAIAIALVVLPLLFAGLPVELSRWQLASALAKLEAEDYEGAEQALDKAARYAPRDPTVYLIQAQVYRAFEKLPQSLAAADRALELTPNSREALRQRGATLMQMERFSQAAAAFEASLDPNWSAEFTMSDDPLNTLAYARALAGENLPEALKEINQALDRSKDDPTSRAAMLDTRGLILFKQVKLNKALADLDEAISLADLRRMRHLLDTVQKTRPGVDVDLLLEQSRTNLAVMYYHPALIHAAMNNPELAAADNAKVRELGHEPTESLF